MGKRRRLIGKLLCGARGRVQRFSTWLPFKQTLATNGQAAAPPTPDPNMPPEMIPIDGEEKKRVVSYLSMILNLALRDRTHPRPQCYFFDSDVSGFHYGPGHPYAHLSDMLWGFL